MFANLVEIWENRRIGSTYPKIRSKRQTKCHRTIEKLRLYLLAKGVNLFNSFRRCNRTTTTIDLNEFEVIGKKREKINYRKKQSGDVSISVEQRNRMQPQIETNFKQNSRKNHDFECKSRPQKSESFRVSRDSEMYNFLCAF